MRPKKIIFICFLITFSNFYGQKSRMGETPTFSSKINLVSFNNPTSNGLNNDSILKYNKPIAIFFWLSTCGPCIKELNAVKGMNIFNEIKGKAKIIVVSDDRPKSYGTAKLIAKKNEWEFDMYFDIDYKLRNSLLNNWYGVPQVMILDKDKKIVLHKFGYRKGDENKIIDKLRE